MLSVKQSLFFSIVMLVAGIIFTFLYMMIVSPQAIMKPQFEHAHFRMQLVVDDQAVNFGEAAFQQPTSTVCTDEVSAEPIHFHDNKDQLVHLHWKGLSGGLVLKNYGWNLIGGPDSLLGYRFDTLPLPRPVPIFGDVLPPLPRDAVMWVYTGDEHGYELRKVDDFLWQDVETFFGTQSTINANQVTHDFWRDLLFSRAGAHDGPHGAAAEQHSQDKLETAANLLGNVVIFVQSERPADAQVQERFQNLVPLDSASCGG